MDFFGGWRPSPAIDKNLSVEENEMLVAEDIANKEMRKQKQLALARARNLKLNKIFRDKVGLIQQKSGDVIEQSAIAAQQSREQPDFSSEQIMLGKMFGQGEHIWGTNNQPVTINNDLNSSRSNPFDETAGMFGFGRNGERSGLF